MVSLFFNNCNKFDVRSGIGHHNKDIFKLPPSSPHALAKIVAELKRQNELTGFMKDFVLKEGYPLWEKSIYQKVEKNNPSIIYARGGAEETADTVVYTPVALLDSNFVNGFIISKVYGDSVELHLYRANDYDLYPYGGADSSVVTAELITLTLAQLDYNSFGPRKFEILDPLLKFENHTYDSTNKVRILKLDFSSKVNSLISGMICYYEPSGFCNCSGRCDWRSGCSSCSVMSCTPYQSFPGGGSSSGSNGGSTNWPPDPPTNPGGGNNPPAPSNCTGVNECRPGSQIVEGKVPCGGCGSGPIVVIPPDNPNSTQYILDLHWMDLNIKDSTNDPCITNTINSLRSLDTTVPKLIRDFFGVSPSFKMVISTELFNTWAPTANPNEYKAPHGGQTIYNLNSDTFDVKINKYYSKATDLAVASTILHEAFHCQLMYWVRHAEILNDTALKNQLARDYGYVFESGLIASDSNLLNIITAQPVTAQHQTMAVKFINLIAGALQNFGLKKGIIVPYSYYEKLAWSGMTDSKAFKLLGSTEIQEIKNAIFSEKDPTSQKLDPDGNPLNSLFIQPKGLPCP